MLLTPNYCRCLGVAPNVHFMTQHQNMTPKIVLDKPAISTIHLFLGKPWLYK